jgi:predicted metal-dependent HD superfamily phosphohydrolase
VQIDVKDRFQKYWMLCGAKTDAENQYLYLKKRYSESNRYYHNLDHIQNCLNNLDDFCGDSKKIPEIEFALWYHDIVYNPAEHDNEEKSAAIAAQICRDSGLIIPFCKTVEELILITKHDNKPANQFQQIMVDIDLCILGSDPVFFDIYEKNIRKEYSLVNNYDFFAGRKIILERFLKRDRIYYTDYFSNKYEKIARSNLHRAIDILKTRQK